MPAIIFICVLIFFIVYFLASFVKIELEYDADFFVKVKYLCFTLFMTPKSKRMLKKEKKKEEKERKKRERLLIKREKLRKKREKGQHLKGKKPEQPKNSGNKTAIPEKCSDKEQSVKIQKLSDKSQNSSGGKKKEPQKSHEKDKPKPKPETIIGCIKAAKPYVKRLFKKIRFYDIFSEIVVGGDDAAKTAIAYGVHCAAVYGLVIFLKNTVSFKEKKIDIKANFDLEKTDYYFYGKVKLRLSTLLYCAVWGFFAVKKAMSEDQSQKGNVKDSKGAPKKAA